LDVARFDLVIALDKSAVQAVQEMAVPETKLRVWKIKDPWGGDLTEYDRAAIEIKKRLYQLKASGIGLPG
jgi:protein-tyrosine-phosphatase